MISISAKNGDIFDELLKDVLYHHSAKGNHLTRCVCLWIQRNEDILLDIYSQSQFSHKIEDGKMSYEPIVYPNKKTNQSINF